MRKASCALLGLLWLLGGLTLAAEAREITGKVMAVYHEPVMVNNHVLDKVSVTVNSCNPANALETVSYSPGSLSDDNSLGSLYGELAGAAHAMVMKTPYMNTVSGHVTLIVNEQNVIQKTTFWGYNWECGRNIDAQANGQPGGFPGMPPQQPGMMIPPQQMPQQGAYPNMAPQAMPPAQGSYPSTPPVNPLDIMRRFGF